MTIKNLAFDYLDNSEAMLYGERVAYAIETKGVSKAWIAEKLGISKQAFNYILKHASKPKFIDEISELLNLDPAWLETGIGASFKTGESKPNQLVVSTRNSLLGHPDTINPGTIDFSSLNPSEYIAYKLEDHSNFPPFIEKSILIFNKKKLPSNEDYVLAIINNEVIVRQYIKDGKNVCFKANNNEHKSFINPKANILGVLIEARYKV